MKKLIIAAVLLVSAVALGTTEIGNRVFRDGVSVYGMGPTTDALPAASTYHAPNAYGAATGANKVGAALNLEGGIGSRDYACLDIASGNVVLTTVVNGTSVALTGGAAGAGWLYGATCTTSMTALCVAMNANATLGPLITCTASTTHAYVQPKQGCHTLTIGTDQATRTSATSGANGPVKFPGATVRAAAGAACSTTCSGGGCLFGQDTAALTYAIVDCSDATADRCLCLDL